MMKIKTNYHDRRFKYADEVPASVLGWYDHLSECDAADGWICHRGHWSHVLDYMRCDAVPGWHGIKHDSWSCGTLIRLSEDGETYRIAWFSC